MTPAGHVGDEAWLGQLPAGWSVKRLGVLGTLVKGNGGSKEDNCDSGVPVVRYGDLYTKFDVTIPAPVAFVSEADMAKYTPLLRHSIVFAASGESAEEIGKSAVSLLDGPAVVGGDTLVLHLGGEVDPMYLAYALESSPVRASKAVRATGFTVVHLSAGRLKTVLVPVPPLAEQRAIADYLARETARIDTLIEEQESLILMLQERRAAALVEAFASMRGEPPAVHQRPIPWLPELRVKQLQMRHLCTVVTGSSDSANAVDEGYPFFVRGDQPLALNRYEFDTEAIITAGDGAMVGRSFHHYRGKFAAHQRVYVLSNFVGVVPRYLYWYFSTFFIRIVGNGGAQATVPSVRMPMIAGMSVPVPAFEEQHRIVAYLDDLATKTTALISKTERFIELARERRTALITSAVTGQIDVRKAA